MHYDAKKQRVRVISDKADGPTAGTHEFEALEYLARLLTHVPDKSSIYVRYYGPYSVRRRARWRELGILTGTRILAEAAGSGDDAPTWPQVQARRRRWAVDPLRCPRCGADMTIVAFVLDHQVVHAILKHLRESRPDPRALPEHDELHLARPP